MSLRKLFRLVRGVPSTAPAVPAPAPAPRAVTVIQVPAVLGWKAYERLRLRGIRLGPVGVDQAGCVLFVVRATPLYQLLTFIAALGWRDEQGLAIRHRRTDAPGALVARWVTGQDEPFLPGARDVLATVVYCGHQLLASRYRPARFVG